MAHPPIHSFDDFWPHYVRAHRHPLNRALHYVGTSCALGCVVGAAVTGNPTLLFVAPLVGYGPAWIGHFLIEGNKPATFGHPGYSLLGDLKMLGLALRGQMAEEVARLCQGEAGEPGPGDEQLAQDADAGADGSVQVTH